MEEDPIEVQLKVISCRDLNTFNFFQKLSTYVVVSIVVHHDDDSKKKMKEKSIKSQQTPVDRDGDINPEWNHDIVFDLREISLSGSITLFLKFDIRCKGLVFGKRTVGEVRVPLEDLLDESNGAVRFVSYQVRSSDGNPNGVLNFSYRINGNSELKINKKKNTQNGNSMLDSIPSGGVSYPSVEIDFPSNEISNPSPAEISKSYYPTSEVVEDMKKMQSFLSPISPPWGHHHSPPPPPGRNGYFYN